jgi:hypothetical protein
MVNLGGGKSRWRVSSAFRILHPAEKTVNLIKVGIGLGAARKLLLFFA